MTIYTHKRRAPTVERTHWGNPTTIASRSRGSARLRFASTWSFMYGANTLE